MTTVVLLARLTSSTASEGVRPAGSDPDGIRDPLTAVLPPRLLAPLAARDGLVALRLAAIARRGQRPGMQRFLDAMRHEPRRLVAHFKDALELSRADRLLRAAEQIDRLQPLVHPDVAVLEDGANANRELPAARSALFETGARLAKVVNLVAVAAMRADRSMRPQHRFQFGNSGGFIAKVIIV